MKRTMWWVALGLLVPALALAVPLQIPYSGQLSENGTPVNGTRSMTFVIYDAATGGTTLYTQAEPTVTMTNGVYHVELNAPSMVWNGADRWLGVSVNGGAELTPRTKIGSVPYAERSGTAEALVNPPPPPGVNFLSSAVASIITTDQWTEVSGVAINAPADGYVFVAAGAYLSAYSGGAATLFCGVAQIAEQVPDPSSPFAVLGQGPNGLVGQGIVFPTTVTQIVPITAGPHTIRLWAKKCGGEDYTILVQSFTMQAIWFPNRYQ